MAIICPNKGPADVAIVGGGVAASATAIALLATGIRPLLLVRRNRAIKMAEAIPASAMRLFEALDLSDVMSRIAAPGRGLDNRWDPENPIRRDDLFMLIERTELAKRMLEEAQSRGTIVEEIAGHMALGQSDHCVIVNIAGKVREFDIAIDASGRAAVCSRPVQRVQHLVADIFEVPCPDPPSAITLIRLNDGWAYRIGSRKHANLVILSPTPQRPITFPAQLMIDFQLSRTDIRWIGRRAAFIQWASRAANDRVIAVGDVAFAHDPVSGQGLRFALASALAAAAVVRTCRRSRDDKALAVQFYEEFVRTERERHGALLQSLYGSRFDFGSVRGQRLRAETRLAVTQMNLMDALRFAATVESAPLNIGGFIERGEVIRLNDGGAVRWLGGFDLVRLRDFVREAITMPQLVKLMVAQGLSAEKSFSIIHWCYAKGILAGERERF
jgi:flavin-dependent dehydrogenase